MNDVRIRRLSALPTTDIGWLQLRDHFIATVGAHSGEGQAYGPLVVLADATFQPHSAFPLHPHREIEILSIVLDGNLSHRGDLANGTTLPPRSAQLTSSRNGMVHAEANEGEVSCRMLQIWLQPSTHGGEAVHFQRAFPTRGRHIVAGDDVMPLRCDARVEWLDLDANAGHTFRVAAGRNAYVMSLDGWLASDVGMLQAGEGLELRAGEVTVTPQGASAVLYFEFAA